MPGAGCSNGERAIGLVALALAVRMVPATARGRLRGGAHLDLPGSLLLGAGVLGLLVPLVDADNGGVSRLWWLWLLAALLFAAFGWWEARTSGGDGSRCWIRD